MSIIGRLSGLAATQSDLPRRPPKIVHITQPRLPQFRFEYHPRVSKLYVIRVGMTPEIGEIIAFHVETEGQAHNGVLTWCRGYLTRDVEIIGERYHNKSLTE